MNYTLSQLNVFVKVVENQSVTKAAEHLHMTQPAVSIQLKNFQDQFEIPLFEVISRRIYITAFGKEVADSAKEILLQAEILKHKAKGVQGDLIGTLTIAVVSTGKYVMPFFLGEFLKQHPKVNLKMDVTNKAQVISNLEKNEVDFALVSILPSKMEVDCIPILKNNLFLVGRGEEDYGKMTNKKLSKLPLILRENGSGTRQTMEKFLKTADIVLERQMELTSNEAVKQAVKAGIGFSIMPLIGLKHELESNEIQVIPLKGLPISTEWQLIAPKGKRHGPVANAFKLFLEVEKENTIQQHFTWINKFSS